jgi:hypothetical protein
VKPWRDGFVHVAHSEHPVAATAVGEIAAYLIEHDLLLDFVTKPFAGILEDVAPALRKLVSPTVLMGCASEQLISPDGWLVDGPGIGVLAVNTGEVEPVRFDPGDEIDPTDGRHLIVLADPYSVSVSLLADVCGGYATAGDGPGGTRLVLDETVFTDGAVGVSIPTEQPMRAYADSFLLDGEAWTYARAVLTFSEVDLELWEKTLSHEQREQGWGEAPAALTGFVSKRTFPLSLTVFGDRNAPEQRNKEPLS